MTTISSKGKNITFQQIIIQLSITSIVNDFNTNYKSSFKLYYSNSLVGK